LAEMNNKIFSALTDTDVGSISISVLEGEGII
jgi:hypothetical protein